MKTQKLATVSGFSFSGDTVALAKAHGESEVRRFAHEAYLGPSVYRVHGLTVLVFPTLEGWAYRILQDADKPGIVQPMCNMGGTREQACLSAISHAAQWQWTASVADDVAYFATAFSGLSP